MSEQVVVEKVPAQAEYQGNVLLKLLIFSAALAIAPIASYFLSKDYLWNGNTTLAAITAIVAANSVLVAYIVVSVREESQIAPTSQDTHKDAKEESKKTR